jgi:hypothetical protein
MPAKLPGATTIYIGFKALFWEFPVKEHRRVDKKTIPEMLIRKIIAAKVKESVWLTRWSSVPQDPDAPGLFQPAYKSG